MESNKTFTGLKKMSYVDQQQKQFQLRKPIVKIPRNDKEINENTFIHQQTRQLSPSLLNFGSFSILLGGD